MKYIVLKFSTEIVFFHFREHEKMMTSLKKLLDTSSKIRRNRRRLLVLQIQIIAWLVEFIAGIVGLILIMGPITKLPASVIGVFTSIVYFVLVPSVFLINNEDLKSKIIDNEIYLTITNKFFSRSINRIDYKQEDLEENEIKTENEMTN